MTEPKFIEACPSGKEIHAGHTVTNESLVEHHTALGTRTFDRVLSICSGGEVPFLVLAGRCKELIAVDMSYTALAAAMLKWIACQALGPERARLYFRPKPSKPDSGGYISVPGEPIKLLTQALLPFVPELPLAVREVVEAYWQQHGYNPPPYWERWISAFAITTLQSWATITDEQFGLAMASLDRVTFVHGGIIQAVQAANLADQPFDLIYLSNAMEWTSEPKDEAGKPTSSYYPTLADFRPLLKPIEGLVLSTGGPKWKHIPKNSRDGYDRWDDKVEQGRWTSRYSNSGKGSMTWDHHLYQVIPPVELSQVAS
jgi:hypothetical protein